MMDGEEISEDNFHPFCNGVPMSMSMGGFQSTLLSNGQADCITFLFTEFRLDESGKFFGAMLCSFFLAVFCEGIAYCQIHMKSNNRQTESNHVQRIIMALLYGLQQLLGWLLMLISMTFSTELFASVILGVFAGKLLFPAETSASRLAQDRGNLGRPGPLNDSQGSGEHSQLQHNQQISDDSDSFPEEESRQSSQSCNGSSSSAVRRRRR